MSCRRWHPRAMGGEQRWRLHAAYCGSANGVGLRMCRVAAGAGVP